MPVLIISKLTTSWLQLEVLWSLLWSYKSLVMKAVQCDALLPYLQPPPLLPSDVLEHHPTRTCTFSLATALVASSIHSLSSKISLKAARMFWIISSAYKKEIIQSILQLPTSYLRVTYELPTSYLRVIYKLSTSYLRATYKLSASYLQVICELPTSYLRATYKLSASYLQVICELPTSYLQVIYKLSTSYLQVIYEIPTSYLRVTYKLSP